MTPADYAALCQATAGRNLGTLAPLLGAGFAEALPPAEVNTSLRIAHFVSQWSHETGGFEWMVELGGPTYFLKYDGRRDLGNVQPGDGYRFRGRGLPMLTGRANYASYGQKLGLDLIGDPDQVADPAISTRIACQFWTDHGLNALADADNVEAITRAINGGLTGLADREFMLTRAKAFLAAHQP